MKVRITATCVVDVHDNSLEGLRANQGEEAMIELELAGSTNHTATNFVISVEEVK